MLDTILTPYADLVLLFGRLVVGIIFIYYGLPKIRDLKAAKEEFIQKGIKPAGFWGPFIAFLEVFGGIGIILGVFTWLWAALFSIEMIVGTIWKIRNKKKFGSWSYDLTILAITLTLLAFGAGSIAIL